MQQRQFLHNIAGVRKGMVPEKEEEKKEGFKPVSINHFREKMLMEEKMNAAPQQDNNTQGDKIMGEQKPH